MRLLTTPVSKVDVSLAAAGHAIDGVMEFLGEDNRAARLLAKPRPACCRGMDQPCTPCAGILDLAWRLVVVASALV